MSSQPQLLQIALDPGDRVYTPDWVAKDMVEFFKPTGRILEPCAGDGVFLKYLPPKTEWCEIEKGRDFYKCLNKFDWIIGNPPYRQIKEWLLHSFKLSDNIVYIIPLNSPFNSVERMRLILEWGGMVHLRVYGNGSIFGMDYGFACGAIHFQRGYTGGMYTSFYEGTR